MLGIENITQDWIDGKRLNEYHDRQLHSLKLEKLIKTIRKVNNINHSISDQNNIRSPQTIPNVSNDITVIIMTNHSLVIVMDDQLVASPV